MKTVPQIVSPNGAKKYRPIVNEFGFNAYRSMQSPTFKTLGDTQRELRESFFKNEKTNSIFIELFTYYGLSLEKTEIYKCEPKSDNIMFDDIFDIIDDVGLKCLPVKIISKINKYFPGKVLGFCSNSSSEFGVKANGICGFFKNNDDLYHALLYKIGSEEIAKTIVGNFQKKLATELKSEANFKSEKHQDAVIRWVEDALAFLA